MRLTRPAIAGTARHSAYRSQFVVVTYPWHPLHGQRVRVYGRQRRAGRQILYIEVQPGLSREIYPTLPRAETIPAEEAATRLGICVRSVHKLIRRGVLPATQLMHSAPWQIPVATLETEAVKIGIRQVIHRRRRFYRRFQQDKTLKLPGF